MRLAPTLLFMLLPLGLAAPLEVNELYLEARAQNASKTVAVQASSSSVVPAASSSVAVDNALAGLPTDLPGTLGTALGSLLSTLGGLRARVETPAISKRQLGGIFDNTPLGSILNATQIAALQGANPNSPIPITNTTTLGQLAGAGLLGGIDLSGLIPTRSLPERQIIPLPSNTPLSSILNSTQLGQLQAANPGAGLTGATILGQLPASILAQVAALGITGLLPTRDLSTHSTQATRSSMKERQDLTLFKDSLTPEQLAELETLYARSAPLPDVATGLSN